MKYLKYLELLIGFIIIIYGLLVQLDLFKSISSGLLFIFLGSCIFILGIIRFKNKKWSFLEVNKKSFIIL